LICEFPIKEERRALLLPIDLELCTTNSSCGYKSLMGIALNYFFLDKMF